VDFHTREQTRVEQSGLQATVPGRSKEALIVAMASPAWIVHFEFWGDQLQTHSRLHRMHF